VLFHCGPVDIEPPLGRYLSQLKHYWRAVADNPDTTFVLGHSGALQMEAALDLCKHYPNVYLETSSQGLPNVRRIVAEAPPERVMFGSDWPFYHQATPLAKVFIATEGQPETRARVLWQNAARLFEIGGVERRIAQAVSPNAGVEG
jgi:predicted TIM-barrel fold metal-dependent hydrolase